MYTYIYIKSIDKYKMDGALQLQQSWRSRYGKSAVTAIAQLSSRAATRHQFSCRAKNNAWKVERKPIRAECIRFLRTKRNASCISSIEHQCVLVNLTSKLHYAPRCTRILSDMLAINYISVASRRCKAVLNANIVD